ncbi:unnamed protein product [Protopolystoma xenopodis]|uniref:Uncharacterized protein n=1 Tax=Protopolystoma xenopodis TaxID=117903 RepID=A0A3S5CIE8_9PLAT|nr:unnamed protein product [Protopolystoma xenopodis]
MGTGGHAHKTLSHRDKHNPLRACGLRHARFRLRGWSATLGQASRTSAHWPLGRLTLTVSSSFCHALGPAAGRLVPRTT